LSLYYFKAKLIYYKQPELIWIYKYPEFHLSIDLPEDLIGLNEVFNGLFSKIADSNDAT